MYIKRLEIFGFKSFADRVELELGPWLTAIVGPNGSGKSNIADAVRWALGADSARLLRGTRMEDVIFAGSDGRKGLGIAEVTVTLDNSLGRVPIEFSEIAVTRRVYRSGESEYFINKIPCKLRDIQRLLSGAGLGRDGYSVIEQGKVDAILSSKPEDRRAFFEEACGIARPRLKRNEARRRLDEVMLDLTRVRDILGEVERQLGPLAKKAEAATRFARRKAELDSLEVSIYADSLIRAVEAHDACAAKLRGHEEAARALEARLARIREAREALGRELGMLNRQKESLQAELMEANSALERTAGDARMYDERLRSFGEKLDSLRAALDENRQKHSLFLQELDGSRARLEAVSSELGRQEKALAILDAERASLLDSIADISSRKESAKAEAIEVLSRISEVKNELRAIRNARESLDRARERASQEERRLMDEKSALESELSSLEKARADHRKGLDQVEASLSEARSLEREEAELRAAAGAERQSLMSDLAAKRSEVRILQDAINRHDSFSAGARVVLALAAKGALRGIVGSVGELLRVKDGYEAAIEAAIGRAAENIVTAAAEDAREAINYLRARSAGRATFLPLDLVRPQTLSSLESTALAIPGIVACAASLVDCRDEHSVIRDYLLGRVLVAENLDAAVACARHTGSRLKIVTLEGDVIHAGGAISGGHTKAGAEGIFRRRGALKRLQAEISQKEQSLKELEERDRQAAAYLDSLKRRINSLEEGRSRLREEMVRLDSRKTQLERDIDRAGRALQALGQELGEGREKSTREGERESALSEELERLAMGQSVHEAAIADLTQEEAARQRELSELDRRITEARVEVARLSQEKAGLLDTARRLEGMLSELSCAMSRGEHEVRELDSRIQDTRDKAGAVAESRKVLSEKAREITLRLQETAAMLEDRESRGRQVEVEYAEIFRELDGARARVHGCELEAARLKANMCQVEERLLEAYGVSRDSAIARGPLRADRREVQKKIAGLKAELDEIGPVDMSAIQEHDDLLSRFTALSGDYDDISAAVGWLTRALEVIDRVSADRFYSTFLEIRREFAEVFARLFGGGRADLELEDPASPLESEIRLAAQPPGKRLAAMSLLSGGERALLAISLVFAILRVRPAPVAILDETDAALDEANLRRFTELLRELATRSQFIVVTHRRITMEAAEAIYGVTMEESGISKVISISLQDREAI